MFQLKRKSFFNYNVERFEDVVIKKQKTTKLPKIQKNVKQQEHQEKPSTHENGIPRDFEYYLSQMLDEEEDEEGNFESFEGFFDEQPLPKRENKILKLLKFKNKRQNSEEAKSSVDCSPEVASRPESPKITESSSSSSLGNEVESVPVSNDAEIPVIKIEPDDPEPEILASVSSKETGIYYPNGQDNSSAIIGLAKSLISKEQDNGTANGSPAKSKKGSPNAFAKLNPKFIGLNGSYLCTECPYETVYVTHFERHMKFDHPNMTLYQCEICQFETKSKSHLQVHTMNHLGIKPYKCTVCDYASARKDYVNMHMKCHTKDHTYFCSECTYSTYRADYLNRHVTDKHLKAIF